MTDKLQTTIADIIAWAEDRGIFEHGTISKQYEKHVEEVGELGASLIDDDQFRFKDAVGDVMVTLIIMAAMRHVTVAECLEAAYDQIKLRTGQMISGVFVKDK